MCRQILPVSRNVTTVLGRHDGHLRPWREHEHARERGFAVRSASLHIRRRGSPELTTIGASTDLALRGAMNDLQLSQPAKAPLQPGALSAALFPEPEPEAAAKKPEEPRDDDDKYDVSRLACTE